MKLFSLLTALLLSLSSLNFASDSASLRSLSDEARNQYEQIIQDELDQAPSKSLQGYFYDHDMYPPVYLPHGSHQLLAVSADGTSLTIEDESVWTVGNNYNKEILSWRSTDTLIIYKNDNFSSWLRGFKYKITNTILNSTVEANIYFNPKLDNVYTLTIANIDKCNNIVTLSDGTNWIIKDTYFNSILNAWIVGDCVIVGTNFPWFWEKWSSILINVSMKDTTSAAAYLKQ